MSSNNDIFSKIQSMETPFKKMGYINALSGLIMLIIAIVVLLSIIDITKTHKLTGWICLFFSIGLVCYSIKKIWTGVYMTFKFPISTTQPSSLAHDYANISNYSSQYDHLKHFYTADKIGKMLINLVTYSFLWPINKFEDMFFSFFRPLQYTAVPYYNLSVKLASAIVLICANLLVFFLVLFIFEAGLISSINGIDQLFYMCFLFGEMIYILFSLFYFNLKRFLNFQDYTCTLSSRRIFKNISRTIILPIIALVICKATGFFESKIGTLLGSVLESINIIQWYFLFLALGVIAIIPIAWMLWKRTKSFSLNIGVSELRDNWQQSIHPDELFIVIENKIMAKRRYLKAPNRVYRQLEPNLSVDDKNSKGKFDGVTIQETQPALKDIETPISFKVVRFLTSIAAHSLKIVMVIGLAYLALNLETILMDQALSGLEKVTYLSQFVFGILAVGVVANILERGSFLFFSELQFESLLFYFQVSGTFTTSRVSTGMSVYDSTRSENDLVRASISPIILVSRIISTTFLGFGGERFENKRYIMELNRDDYELNSIVDEFKEYLQSRENIASVVRDSDLKSVNDITTINTRSFVQKQKFLSEPDVTKYTVENSYTENDNS